MIVDTQAVLEIGGTYRVQNVSKFPKDKSYMIGQNCILKKIIGGSASILHKGRMTDIPLRSLINVTGYTAKGVATKNADGFIVTQQNVLGLPVGLAILNPDVTRKDSIEINYNNRNYKVPFLILSAIVEDKKIEKPLNSVKISEKTGVSPQLIEVCDELLSSHENRKDIEDIPAALLKLLPGVNLIALRDKLRNSEDGWFDLEGNVHATIAEAERSNTKIRHKQLTNTLIEMSTSDFKRQAEEIRTKAFA